MEHTPAMKRESYDAEIKVRVPTWLKRTLDAQASSDDLELSDIVRRALKDYALRRQPPLAPAMGS